ncbi:uncharacterized protein LOC132587657 [Heteronotia binoei]|uniref:uncharacterized protein LOC132587657 n=1 Tax=Heteronotia binoei TaxID=13085 RepID=UPI00292F2912|nr:uncharacterized protein LOC132587657 [Heteronotia binoei]
MYRSYQPLFPATSRYLQEKWDKTNYQEHRRKVELAVPVVDTTALPVPLHLQVNLKKMQLEKERHTARGRDNLRNHARLRGIKQSQGRVDNWNFYCRHSLNWEKRQRDLEQIYWENRQLMKRLAEKKSELAQGRWQQDWHREQLIRNSLARYPRGTRSCQVRKKSWIGTGRSGTTEAESWGQQRSCFDTWKESQLLSQQSSLPMQRNKDRSGGREILGKQK